MPQPKQAEGSGGVKLCLGGRLGADVVKYEVLSLMLRAQVDSLHRLACLRRRLGRVFPADTTHFEVQLSSLPLLYITW